MGSGTVDQVLASPQLTNLHLPCMRPVTLLTLPIGPLLGASYKSVKPSHTCRPKIPAGASLRVCRFPRRAQRLWPRNTVLNGALLSSPATCESGSILPCSLLQPADFPDASTHVSQRFGAACDKLLPTITHSTRFAQAEKPPCSNFFLRIGMVAPITKATELRKTVGDDMG
jgi:hypothetical protein